jgi:hypothetical protein
MRSYRPKLLRTGAAAARIRNEVLDMLVNIMTGRGAEVEAEVFWNGVRCDANAMRGSKRIGATPDAASADPRRRSQT